MNNQIVITSVITLLLAIVAYFTGRKKNKAEAGDLISQSAVRLVTSMETRVKALETQAEKQDKQIEILKKDVASRSQRINALEQEVAWLFDQLLPETQIQFHQRFKRPHIDSQP